jgi:hypothetical protein
MRLLDLIRQPKVSVTVAGDVLMVTMPGTTFSVTYENTDSGTELRPFGDQATRR